MPAWLVWVAGFAVTTLLVAVPWLTRPRGEQLPAPASVNERACTGCEQCVLDCPYDAIEMVPRADARDTLVARVKTELCTSCGICIGSCAPMAIGPLGVTARDQLAEIRDLIAEAPLTERDVVLIGCSWSSAQSEAARCGARLLPVPCVGALHTSTVELLLRSGAGGVLVVGCPEHDGRTREGVTWTRERLYEGRKAELKERVDERRVRLVQATVGEAVRLHEAVLSFANDMALLDDGAAESIDVLSLCRGHETVDVVEEV
jgi:ferredoxin